MVNDGVQLSEMSLYQPVYNCLQLDNVYKFLGQPFTSFLFFLLNSSGTLLKVSGQRLSKEWPFLVASFLIMFPCDPCAPVILRPFLYSGNSGSVLNHVWPVASLGLPDRVTSADKMWNISLCKATWFGWYLKSDFISITSTTYGPVSKHIKNPMTHVTWLSTEKYFYPDRLYLKGKAGNWWKLLKSFYCDIST